MNVLVVTPFVPHVNAVNAGERIVYGHLHALLAHGHVTLATFAGPDPAEQAAVEGLRNLGIDVHTVWNHKLTRMTRWTRRWRLASGLLCSGHPSRLLEFLDPRMQTILDQLLTGNAFDLIQVEHNLMAAFRYGGDVPALLIEHEVGLIGATDARKADAHWLRRLWIDAEWRRWLHDLPDIWRRFDRIQVFTPRDAAVIRAAAPELAARTRVNPFGIELPRPANPEHEEPDTVVFVGGFGHPPNVDAALWLAREIMPRLWASCPHARLLLVGSRPPEQVQALATANIVVTGWVPEVEPYLERAAVVLAPVRTGGGMRMKVLQAMALGKAVVTTSLGAEGLATGSCSLPLVIGDDAETLAQAAAYLLVDIAERRALGAQARAFVARHHSWQSYIHRLDDIYDELMPRKGDR